MSNLRRSVLGLVLCAVSVYLFTACTQCQSKPDCDVTAKYSDLAASKLAPVLGCKNPAAMSADFNTELAKLNLCSDAPKAGPLSDLVCAPLAAYLASLPPKKLPVAWECDGGVAVDWTTTALTGLCLKVPF